MENMVQHVDLKNDMNNLVKLQIDKSILKNMFQDASNINTKKFFFWFYVNFQEFPESLDQLRSKNGSRRGFEKRHEQSRQSCSFLNRSIAVKIWQVNVEKHVLRDWSMHKTSTPEKTFFFWFWHKHRFVMNVQSFANGVKMQLHLEPKWGRNVITFGGQMR